MYSTHDPAITTIRARPKRRAYGMGLGIILLDDVYPGFPGDVRNASGYPFPIQYEIVRDVDINKLVVEDNKGPCLEPLNRAAQHLEKLGCRAVAAECGYCAYFQREIATSVTVPVLLSSLLQVPMAQQLVGAERMVGILMAEEFISPTIICSRWASPRHQLRRRRRDGQWPVREVDHLWTAACAATAGRRIRQGRGGIPGRSGGLRPPAPQHGCAGAGMHRLPALRPRPAA